jgi:uncharacterized repeat protein (TIGR01451 family)
LTANCGDTTAAITVPAGITTVNGAGFTISATDPPPPATTYTGAVLTNAPGNPGPMNIENLTVTGPTAGFAFPLPQPSCNSPFPGLFGIFFNDASGSVTNTNVLNIFQTNTAPGSPACIVGHSIRADGVTAPRTVNITTTHVSNYQRGGMFASGNVTVNVSNSTIGPGSAVPFSIAQNAVQWSNCCTQSNGTVAPSGSITGSTIIGTSFVSTHPVDPASSSSTAVLLFGASNVTVDHNTIEGESDLGISVTAASTNTLISFNAINRPTRPTPDSFGFGVDVTADSTGSTTLECNTFDNGWNSNINGALQISCGLPNGTECQAYSAALTVIGGPTAPAAVSSDAKPAATGFTVAGAAAATDPSFDWSASGTLPPGLNLAPDGTISGTPTTPGTFNFTAKVTDSTSPPLTATQAQTITIAAGSCPAAGISLVKSANMSSFSAAGKVVTYSFKVSNTGTLPLSNVVVTDPLAGLSPVSCPASTLAIGASMTCTATYTTTSADVNRGSVTNTATATGTDPSGVTVGPSTSTVMIPAGVSAPTLVATSPASTPPAAASPAPLAVTGLNETLPIVGLILVALGLACVGGSRRIARSPWFAKGRLRDRGLHVRKAGSHARTG